MTPKRPPPMRAPPMSMKVSSGFTSRDTSFHGFEIGTASATPAMFVKWPGSTGPWLPVMPMASRVAPGISLGTNPSARTLSSTAAMSARDAPAFMTISICAAYTRGGKPSPRFVRLSRRLPAALLAAGLLGQLLVGDLLEGLERVGARDLAAVDE